MSLANDLQVAIDHALQEDCASRDMTTRGLRLGERKVKAIIRAKEPGVCAGIDIARQVFKSCDKRLRCTSRIRDGQSFRHNTIVLVIQGRAQSILAAERVALNMLSRLSGIATLTRAYVDQVKPRRVKILDTRKTTPCHRQVEKYAVRMGGGYNHRMNLSDTALIKDNHIAAYKRIHTHASLASMVQEVRKRSPRIPIEIEVNTLNEFKDSLRARPDIIMLDNMNIATMKQCVVIRNHQRAKTKLEVSGNVTLKHIKKIAALGVERISIGSLTHSPHAIDFSLHIL